MYIEIIKVAAKVVFGEKLFNFYTNHLQKQWRRYLSSRPWRRGWTDRVNWVAREESGEVSPNLHNTKVLVGSFGRNSVLTEVSILTDLGVTIMRLPRNIKSR